MLINNMEKNYLISQLSEYKVISCSDKTIICKKNNSDFFIQVPSHIRILSNNNSILFTTDLKFKNEFENFISIFDDFLKLNAKKVFTKRLKITGLGYKIVQEQNFLVLSLGYSKVIRIKIPIHVSNVLIKKNLIVLNSADKVKLGDFVSKLCILKKKDVYKGKGLLPEYKTLKLKPIKKK